ncbi:MAG: hypothetical protein JNN27_12455 [Planctomycetes bacterium]|nr:hypothetical protein [Planctomycetota bacterium]
MRWFEGEAPRDDLGAFEAAAVASGKLALADERGRVVIEGARERVNVAASLPGWWGYMYFDGAGSVVIDGERRRLKIAGNPRGNEWSDVQLYAWPRVSSGHAAQHREDSSSLSLVLHADQELDFHVVDREGIGVPGVPVLLWSPMNAGARSLHAVSGVDGNGAFRHASAWWEAETAFSRFIDAHNEARQAPDRDKTKPMIEIAYGGHSGGWPRLEVESLPHSSRRRIELGKELPRERVVVSASDLTEVVLSVRTIADVAPLDGGWVADPDDRTRFPLEMVAGVSQARLWVHADSAPTALYARRNSSSAEYPFSIWRPAVLAGRADAVVGRDHRTLRVRPLIDGGVRPHTEFTLVWEHAVGPGPEYRPWVAEVTSDAYGHVLVDIKRTIEPERLLVVSRSTASPDLVGLVETDEWKRDFAEVALVPRWEVTLQLRDDLGTPLAGKHAKVMVGNEPVDPVPNRCEVSWRVAFPSDLQHATDKDGCMKVSRSNWSYVNMFGSWGRPLTVSVDGHATAELEFDANAKSATLVLPRAATMRGYVRTADPDKVAGLNLLLLRRESDVPEAKSPGVTLGCSCDGRFEFEALRPAEYTLIVRRVVSGARPVEITRRNKLVLMPGEVLDLGEIVID